MRGYSVRLLVLASLLLLVIPLSLAAQPVLLTVPQVPPQVPCAPLSVPVSVGSMQPVVLSVAAPYNRYVTPAPSLVQPGQQSRLQGQLPCSMTGAQKIDVIASSLTGQVVARKSLVLTLVPDYAFLVSRKDALVACAENVTAKRFVLRNKGNVPNIYTIAVSAGSVVPSRIVLAPGKEKVFSLFYHPPQSKDVALTVTAAYGKRRQTYTLQWEVEPCMALQLFLPEEVTACRGKPAKVAYTLQNNGTEPVNVQLTFGEMQENLSLASGTSTNKTLSLPEEESRDIIISAQVNGKTAATTILHLRLVSPCNKLIADNPVVGDGLVTVDVLHAGVDRATYSFDVESPDELSVETRSLTLVPGQEAQLVLLGNLTRSEDLIVLAHDGNETQRLRVYLDAGTAVVDWEEAAVYGPTLGIAVFVLVLVLGTFLLVRNRKGITTPEDDFDLAAAKPSWFSRNQRIDFATLFEEDVAYAPIVPKKKFPWWHLLLIGGLLLLAAGAYGLMSLYPDEGLWFILLIGGSVVGVIGAAALLWFIVKRVGVWWIIVVLVLGAAVALYEPSTNEAPVIDNVTESDNATIIDNAENGPNEDSSAIAFILSAILAFVLLVSILRKGWKSWDVYRERRKHEKAADELAHKIATVERKTTALRNTLLQRSAGACIRDYFFAEDTKPFLQQILDFFFEDVPEDFAPEESKQVANNEQPKPAKRRNKRVKARR
ncbi:hypothetical protein HY639_06155 [Candidatus Woesearchaeota archaeon]|nr:hypothetical protein [Candidatus Woesearchaeota archaeon]